MNAPTGRKIRVSVSENAICASDLPNSFAMAVRHITTRKKSNASSVQPRNPAVTAAPWSERGAAGAVMAGQKIRYIAPHAHQDAHAARDDAGPRARPRGRGALLGAPARRRRVRLGGGADRPVGAGGRDVGR